MTIDRRSSEPKPPLSVVCRGEDMQKTISAGFRPDNNSRQIGSGLGINYYLCSTFNHKTHEKHTLDGDFRFFLWGGVFAQQTVTPPTFNGAERRFFGSRLTAEAKKLALEKGYRYDELTERIAVAFRVDTAGRLSALRFCDTTCQGADSNSLAPATPRTREMVTAAFESIGGEWQPARLGERAVPYTVRLRIQLPVSEIERAQNPDPLLFLGEDPAKSFYPWLRARVRYDERFAKVGGRVHIRFFIEPDGSITIDEVVQSPDKKLTKEVLRVIRNSHGKWSPRKMEGVPQRTPYDLRVNFINESY